MWQGKSEEKRAFDVWGENKKKIDEKIEKIRIKWNLRKNKKNCK